MTEEKDGKKYAVGIEQKENAEREIESLLRQSGIIEISTEEPECKLLFQKQYNGMQFILIVEGALDQDKRKGYYTRNRTE